MSWTLRYEGFDPSHEGLREALCTLGNGVFATRGAAPESQAGDVHYPGTYLAGCYDRAVTDVAGRAIENEDLVNVPNWLPLTFRLDGGAWFDVAHVELLAYEQELDLRRGVLLRLLRFRSGDRITRVVQRRVVSMGDPHLAALETTFVAENWSGRLEVRSALDGTVTNAGVRRYRDLEGRHLAPIETGEHDAETLFCLVETRRSHIRIAEAARTRVIRHGATDAVERRLVEEPGFVAHQFSIGLDQAAETTVEKVVALSSSLDDAIFEPGLDARTRIGGAPGFDELLRSHGLVWQHLWRRFDLRIEGDARTQMVLRLHLFHLLQTLSEHTIGRDVGVPARGLHGEAYRGHVFWDELFILPFLNLHLPALTRSLLQYRYRRLGAARWAAAQAGYAGAMFPWQSGTDGREESQVVHLNPSSGRWLADRSHRQRHVNIAIAYNVWNYYQVTGDLEFLRFRGAEMLIEIARFWASVASYDRSRDCYEIRGVMGPDEYHDGYPSAETPGVNNNAYTNVMVAWVLTRALELADRLPEHHRQEVWERLDVTQEELQRWEDISRNLYVPFHGDGIISQFEGYAELEELDWQRYIEAYGDIHRLDRILEAEGDTPNRYQVSKQADVLMLFYLLSDTELEGLFARLGYSFDAKEDARRNVEYYLARTSHGSTLSRVVDSWILARLHRPRSWQLFLEAVESDISDTQGGTTPEGIHLGAMAGTVDLVQRCYGGVHVHDDVLWIDPSLPAEFPSLGFQVHYRGHRLQIEVRDQELQVSSVPGPWGPIRVGIRGEVIELAPGQSEAVSFEAR